MNQAPGERTFAAYLKAVKDTFGDMIVGLNDGQCDALPTILIDYLKDNPGNTALQLALLLVVFVPGLVAGPGLLALGFGQLGPMAGKSHQLPWQQVSYVGEKVSYGPPAFLQTYNL